MADKCAALLMRETDMPDDLGTCMLPWPCDRPAKSYVTPPPGGGRYPVCGIHFAKFMRGNAQASDFEFALALQPPRRQRRKRGR